MTFQNSFSAQPLIKSHLVAIKRKLLESRQIPEQKIAQMAKHIKPLMRLRKKQKPNAVLFQQIFGIEFRNTDLLVWLKPQALNSYYIANFKLDDIATDSKGNYLLANNLEKVAEFTCYHDFKMSYNFLPMKVEDVLRQFPATLPINNGEQYAFEIKLASQRRREVYDQALDCFVSTVIVYRVINYRYKDR